MRAFELYEKYEGTSRSIPLTEEQAKELLAKNCSQIQTIKTPIYRGLWRADSPFMLSDPSKGGPRTAANTHNYMNLIMSNMDSWAHYPRRDRSLICSTSKNNSENYGEIYRVYPYDGTLIGVCPADDIWDSFSTLKMSVEDFCETIYGAYKQEFGKQMEEHDYPLFMQQMSQLSDKIAALSEEELGEYFYEFFIVQLKKHKTLLNMVLSCSPEANKFALTDTSNFTVKGKGRLGKEVWVGGPAILVRLDYAGL